MNNSYNIIITETPSGYYNFTLKNDINTLLSSENYTSRRGCNNGAISLKVNGKRASNYTSLNHSNKFIFVIKAGNGEILARSKKFDNEEILKKTISNVILIFENDIPIINK